MSPFGVGPEAAPAADAAVQEEEDVDETVAHFAPVHHGAMKWVVRCSWSSLAISSASIQVALFSLMSLTAHLRTCHSWPIVTEWRAIFAEKNHFKCFSHVAGLKSRSSASGQKSCKVCASIGICATLAGGSCPPAPEKRPRRAARPPRAAREYPRRCRGPATPRLPTCHPPALFRRPARVTSKTNKPSQALTVSPGHCRGGVPLGNSLLENCQIPTSRDNCNFYPMLLSLFMPNISPSMALTCGNSCSTSLVPSESLVSGPAVGAEADQQRRQ